ncbi:MAG TPA: hypothetical protein VIB62_07370 [Actinomycetota bacterium]
MGALGTSDPAAPGPGWVGARVKVMPMSADLSSVSSFCRQAATTGGEG